MIACQDARRRAQGMSPGLSENRLATGKNRTRLRVQVAVDAASRRPADLALGGPSGTSTFPCGRRPSWPQEEL